jgi:hypothetical protein
MSTEKQANSSFPFKKGDTNPFGVAAYQPKGRFWRRIIVISTILIAAGGLAVVFKLLPAKDKSNKDVSSQLQVNEIMTLEIKARQVQKQLLDIFTALTQKSGINADGWDFSAPSAEQMQTLQKLAPEPKDLLASYLAKRNEYVLLKQSIRALETRLGTPRLVRPGDTHFKMAYDFLISQTGRPDEEVRRILQQTRLQEPLLPGFKVWNFWLAGGFCTFVTQGDAPLTPEEATSQTQEKKRQEKEQALASLNSLFLIIGTLEDLQSRQILIGGFLRSTRMGEVPVSAFRQTVDLRNQRAIRIQGADFKLKKIVRVAVFPREFRSGSDYNLRISPQGSWALFSILKADAFRGRYMVISVE